MSKWQSYVIGNSTLLEAKNKIICCRNNRVAIQGRVAMSVGKSCGRRWRSRRQCQDYWDKNKPTICASKEGISRKQTRSKSEEALLGR